MSFIASWLERLTPWQLAILLAIVAEALFLVHIGQPNKLMFDETWYVPAARQTFGMLGRSNEEHPLFAKWLIGLSMKLFGDTPTGWRMLSSVAGVATMLSLYAIALRLFGSTRTAVTAALLALLNQMLFIQARIAMLDVFCGAFLTGGIALLVWGYRARNATRHLIWAGIALGLAVGCKWLAFPYLAAIGVVCLLLRWTRGEPHAWPRVTTGRAILYLGLFSLIAYFATFAPALFYRDNPLKLYQLLAYQSYMYGQQTQPLAAHTYQSSWWQWPLITRPIWYLYESVKGVQRGVLLLGNPAIMWGGLVALAACLQVAVRDRSRPLLLVAGLYLFALGTWIVIPKRIGFYYYYYLPGLFLTLVLAGALHHFCRDQDRWMPATMLALSFGLFVYFYPILSAAPLPNDQAFLHWMWFSTWP